MIAMIKVTVMLVCVSAYQSMDIKWTAHLTDVSVHLKILIKHKKVSAQVVYICSSRLLLTVESSE